MTGKKEILQALAEELGRCVPEAEHYFGKIIEGYRPPAFLYLPIYEGESRHNAFFRDTTLEIQVIYFGRTDGYGTEDFWDKTAAEEKVKKFVNGFLLPVGDRQLLFEYETREADERLTFFMKFRYKEDAPMEAFLREAERKPAEGVIFRERVK